MFGSIKYSLAGLTNFSGRDTRSTFWIYVLFLFALYIVAAIVMSLFLTSDLIGDTVTAARYGVSEAEMQKQVYERMGGLVRKSAWGSAAIAIVATALIAASFTRRLHDSNKPGWIAGAVIALQVLAAAWSIGRIDQTLALLEMTRAGNVEGVRMARMDMMGPALFGYLPLLLFVVFGLLPSSDGANRYGPEPDHI